MQVGAVIGGRFAIEREVAAGGMGCIFRAHDRHTNTLVAIKVVDSPASENSARFQREAVILAELTHPAIVRYVAHGTLPTGEQFLAMEWLEGEDLSARLKRHRRQASKDPGSSSGSVDEEPASLSIGETLAMAQRVAGALGALHARSLIHRDIKPSNIFLPAGALDRAKVLDFGLTRLDRASTTMTRTGVLVGTPSYMAPEQARGAKNIDATTDVWALGCVIFECLTGAPPFRGEHIIAVLAKIITEQAPRLRTVRTDIPESLDNLVARMLSSNPAHRPPHGDAVAAELATLGERDTSSVRSIAHVTLPEQSSSLTLSEQRVECVIVGCRSDEAPSPDLDIESSSQSIHRSLLESLTPYGVQIEPLMDGSLVVAMTGNRVATDQAARAARAALAMQAILPGVPLVLASGRTEAATRSLLGHLIDRAVGDLATTAPGKIRVDALTADLLESRFELVRENGAPYLVGEIEFGGRARPLLGKPAAWVGRDRELSTLEGILSECVSEPIARAVLVTAPTGAGKSRLRYEFIRRLRAREESTEVLFSQGDSLSAGAPFVMIAPAIRRLADILDGEPLETRREKLKARIGRHLPEKSRAYVTAFIGELVSVPFPEETTDALRAARAEPALMGDAMREAWETWLEAECNVNPVVIVLEDLHWGDLPSIKFIDAALRTLRDLPFMVLALARPDVQTQFPQLWADHAVQAIRLSALSRKASEKFVRQVLGKDATDAIVDLIIERSEGNAFYLEEMIRAVAAGTMNTLPDSILGIVQARLDALGSEAKRVLRAGSIFGEVFWRGGVLALLGGDRWNESANEWLEDLVSREVIARHPSAKIPGEVEYAFRHALVRESAYAMLTEGDRTLGHRLAATWFEQSGQADALVLAEHYIRGAAPTSALPWYKRAAEQALEGNDLAAAIDSADKAIRCDAQGEALGALRHIQAVAYYWQSKYVEAQAAALEATNLLARGSDLWFRAVAETIVLSVRRGQTDQVGRWVDEALDATPDETALGAKIVCLCRCCIQLLYISGPEAMDAILKRVDVLAPDRSLLDPHVAAQVYHVNAVRLACAGNHGNCNMQLERAISLFEQAGDRRNAALERPSLCISLVELGDFARAEQTGRKALAECERLGAPQAITYALVNCGYSLVFAGKLEEGGKMLHDAVKHCQAQNNPRLQGRSGIHLSTMESLRGDFAEAEREARAAVELLTVSPPLRAWAQATLVSALLSQGKSQDARAVAEDAFATLKKLGSLVQGESIVWPVYAEALAAVGETALAREAIVAGRARFIERLSWIEQAEWKESFARHPDNARLLLLAEAWAGLSSAGIQEPA